MNWPLWKQCLLLLSLTLLGGIYSLLAGLAPLPWAEPELHPGEIRLTDARVLDPIWVDARSEAEYAERHIPGALFFDQNDPGRSMADVAALWLERPRPIIIYCADAACGTSRQVAEQMRGNLPGAEIYSLRGGWQTWAE